MSLNRLWYIIKKEFIQIKRDKTSLAISFVMPIMMLVLFGYAVKSEVEHIPTIVFDMSNSQESRELLAAFENSNYFYIMYSAKNIHEVEDAIDSGNAKAGIVITPDYSNKINKGDSPQIQFIVDGSDPTVAKTALSSAILISRNFSVELNNKTVNNVQSNSVDFRPKVWYNPNLKSEYFTIPGIVGLIMQNITVMLTAFALVREKERGTIEQLIVTPIKKSELILGKLIPYIIIGILEFVGVLYLGVFMFNVPIKGSHFLLFILGTGFVSCALAIGILISTVAKNQLQAMQGLVMVILPSILLSGFMFPREEMPIVIRIIGYVIPLTYFIDIIRGIMLKGLSLRQLQLSIYPLLFLGSILIILSILRFRKKLD
jgi:ABC-2 type transport system permease protein